MSPHHIEPCLYIIVLHTTMKCPHVISFCHVSPCHAVTIQCSVLTTLLSALFYSCATSYCSGAPSPHLVTSHVILPSRHLASRYPAPPWPYLTLCCPAMPLCYLVTHCSLRCLILSCLLPCRAVYNYSAHRPGSTWLCLCNTLLPLTLPQPCIM